MVAISPNDAYYLIIFWRHCVGNFLAIFCSYIVFKAKHSKTKRKCIGWMLGNIYDLDLDLTHDLDLGYFKIIFRNSCISGIVNLIDVRRKGSESDIGLNDLALWPSSWTWPWHFRDKIWTSLISGMGGLIDMMRKGHKSSNHDHDINLCVTFFVTMVGGWMYRLLTGVTSDVRGAVDISSCLCFWHNVTEWEWSLTILSSYKGKLAWKTYVNHFAAG